MTNVCDQCGKEFEARNRRHKRCSTGCKQAYNKAFNRIWYDEGKRTKQSVEQKMFYNARERCIQSKRIFDITLSDIKLPENNLCPILGVELKALTRYAPSLDRKDSSKGYTPDNIWGISRLANKMKNDSTPEELRRFGKWAKIFQL